MIMSLSRTGRTLIRYLILVCTIIGLDRVTKQYMRLVENSYIINDFLSFSLHYNRGISWGMFHSDTTAVFAIVTCSIALFILIFCLYTFVRYHNNYIIVGELMVCAGALSNLLDRFLYGGVVDFIVLSYKAWTWPVFNIADMAIVIGLFCIMFVGFFSDER